MALMFAKPEVQMITWKGRQLTLKGFANMIPQMTQTDVNTFLDNKELVKQASDYLKKNPKDKQAKKKDG